MRVAILNRDRSLWPGGDLVEIDNRIEALARLGVACEYNPRELRGFDVVHCFHVNFDWAVKNLQRAQRCGLPFVVTPLYYPGEGCLERIRECLVGASAIMPLSKREACEMTADEMWHKFHVIPNGTSPAFHAEPDSDRTGVCTAAARPENSKNSGLIEYACELAGIPYFRICSMSTTGMPQMYRMFRMFATASSSERMSLTVGEALCSGCRVFSTIHNRGNEWYPGLRTIDPAIKPEALAPILADAYYAAEWDWRPNEAARLLTWDRCAAATLEVYERAIRARREMERHGVSHHMNAAR